jgi:hypothetical protein
MRGVRPILGVLGAALLLAPEAGAEAFARISLQLEPGMAAPVRMQDQGLEKLRAGNPTGRALPMLQALAGPSARTVELEYVGSNTLIVEVAPTGGRLTAPS